MLVVLLEQLMLVLVLSDFYVVIEIKVSVVSCVGMCASNMILIHLRQRTANHVPCREVRAGGWRLIAPVFD